METTAVQPHSEALTSAMSALIRVVQFRDRDRACCYGLSVSQCYGLGAVVERADLTLNELAAELYLEKSTASRLVNGLVESGFITKDADAADRRTLRLRATPRGGAVYSAIHEDLVREYDGLLADLSPREQAAVVKTIRALAGRFAIGIETGGGSCCMAK